MSDDDELPQSVIPNEPIQQRRMKALLENLEGDSNDSAMLLKVKVVLKCIAEQGLDLPIFLDALTWGDDKCTANAKVQTERSGLFTRECMGETGKGEMKRVAKLFFVPKGVDPLAKDTLMSTDLSALAKDAQGEDGAPMV
ncbi:hypothetical protein OF83DRAFT_1177909 [Amylostereum chailletii]|nr:hypothetical protein OF83DRAFT_1177909 [Amylostereum chailletii]